MIFPQAALVFCKENTKGDLPDSSTSAHLGDLPNYEDAKQKLDVETSARNIFNNSNAGPFGEMFQIHISHVPWPQNLFRCLCMLKSFLKMYKCHCMLFKHDCLWLIKRMKCTGLSSYDFYYFKVSVNQSGGVQFIPCQQRYDTFTSWSGSPIMQYAVHSSNGTYIVSEDKGQGNDITIWVVHLDCTLIWITTI